MAGFNLLYIKLFFCCCFLPVCLSSRSMGAVFFSRAGIKILYSVKRLCSVVRMRIKGENIKLFLKQSLSCFCDKQSEAIMLNAILFWNERSQHHNYVYGTELVT